MVSAQPGKRAVAFNPVGNPYVSTNLLKTGRSVDSQRVGSMPARASPNSFSAYANFLWLISQRERSDAKKAPTPPETFAGWLMVTFVPLRETVSPALLASVTMARNSVLMGFRVPP